MIDGCHTNKRTMIDTQANKLFLIDSPSTRQTQTGAINQSMNEMEFIPKAFQNRYIPDHQD